MTNVADAPMQLRQALACSMAVTRALLLAAERAALPPKLRQEAPKRTRTLDALEFLAWGIGQDREGFEPAIDAHRQCLAAAGPALDVKQLQDLLAPKITNGDRSRLRHALHGKQAQAEAPEGAGTARPL